MEVGLIKRKYNPRINMEQIVITKKFSVQNLFNRAGFDEAASAELFLAYLKEAWEQRAKREWPGSQVVIRLTVVNSRVYDTALEICGRNAAGDIEDLDWQIPDYEGDALRLCEQFHAWTVPIVGN